MPRPLRTTKPRPSLDEKFIVFNREKFLKALYQMFSEEDIQAVVKTSIPDAVVIRRQDFFASPALATYANCIALVAARERDHAVKQDLLRIADYFEQQARLAAEEGWKLPSA